MNETNPPGDNFSNKNMTTTTYSSIVNTYKYPTKDQAVVLSAMDGVKIHDYIIAIGSLIQPKNVLFASRIANNRICIYLSSKNIVDNFLSTHNTIRVNGTQVEIRRLISPAQRLVISNICPTIPNSLLEEELRKMGISAVSKITFLKIGMPESEYSHVLSFRRQIYIKPLQHANIPDSFNISHDNTTYRLYLYIDGSNCQKCKTIGHQESDCPSYLAQQDPPEHMEDKEIQSNPTTEKNSNLTSSSTEISITTIPSNTSSSPVTLPSIHIPSSTTSPTAKTTQISHPPLPSTSIFQSSSSSTIDIIQTSKPTSRNPPSEVNTQTTKRQISTSPDIQENSPNPTFVTPLKPSKQRKRAKMSSKDIEDILIPIKEQIEDRTPPFILNFTQICDFLENSINSKHPKEIAQQYSNEDSEIKEILNFIYKHSTTKGIKNNITRLKKKLSLSSLSTTEESDSEPLSQEN